MTYETWLVWLKLEEGISQLEAKKLKVKGKARGAKCKPRSRKQILAIALSQSRKK